MWSLDDGYIVHLKCWEKVELQYSEGSKNFNIVINQRENLHEQALKM